MAAKADLIIASELHTTNTGQITGFNSSIKCASKPTRPERSNRTQTAAAIICLNRSLPFMCITEEGDKAPTSYTAGIIQTTRKILVISVYVIPKNNEVITQPEGAQTTYL